jgi:uncharacterized SAM-binding protein YcdF (DUF218 family)
VRSAFFELSKLLDLLLAPLSWVLLLLAAAFLLRRRGWVAWALVGTSAAVILVLSSEPVADRLMAFAEAPARSTYHPGTTYDAVIVLGGVLEAGPARPGRDPELSRAADRIVRGFELARDGHARNVLLSGGAGHPRPGEVTEAEQLAALLRRWGIPSERIFVETRSRNTRENAEESAGIVALHGWKSLLLVTSAWHVPRALGCFRRVGLSPDVLPVDFAAGDARGQGWLPRVAALEKSSEAIRELAGRVVYRLAGYTAD